MMENTLRVFINFNEKITRRQLEKHYIYLWKRKLPTLLKILFLIMLAIFIIDTFFGNKSRLEFLKVLGIWSGVFCAFYFIIYYYNKANHNIKINKFIDELKTYDPITELYFDEKSFYIKNEQYDIRSMWKKVTYDISGKTIMITIDTGTPFTYLISDDETDQFEDIITFLKTKSRLKK